MHNGILTMYWCATRPPLCRQGEVASWCIGAALRPRGLGGLRRVRVVTPAAEHIRVPRAHHHAHPLRHAPGVGDTSRSTKGAVVW